ncbi:hypothetical protein Q0590_26615 [Rhodocytophaga aerolata]|uniref:DUF1795 domain-containing protein n=1 Tax=Rhodocytophaga aerolata TaxID=455078 RepID=A0ABT8RCP7_9BACT|nr:hypothetical protein [Rhodocytophaga aerolata]MDO1449881.1 hypothetical protein [Rhodocytophaga aerolata]
MSADKPVTAQQMEPVRNAGYDIKYLVPANWVHIRQAHKLAILSTYVNPEETIFFLVGKFKDDSNQLTPEQALQELLTDFGVSQNKFIPTRYNRIRFMQTSGRGIKDGQSVHFDAMAAKHRGNIILLYVYATSDAYLNNLELIEKIAHSMAPYNGRK